VRDLQPFIDYVFPNWLRGRYPSGTITGSLNRPAEVETFANASNWRDVIDDVCASVRARRPLSGAMLHLYLRLLGVCKAVGGRELGRKTLFGPDTPR